MLATTLSITSLFVQPLAQSILLAAVIIIATLVVARLAVRVVRPLLQRDNSPLPSASIIINILRAVIILGGASILLDLCFGISANALLTALGVGGIAISLGFQDTLSNLIGGMQVTFMKIVQPGDNIEIGGKQGVVTDINWRHTTMRDSVGQTIIVPNSVISTSELVHLLPSNRVTVEFHVVRKIDGGPVNLDQVSSDILDAATTAVASVSPIIGAPQASNPAVQFFEITEHGYRGKFFCSIQDANKTYAATDAVIKAISPIVG